MREDFDFLCDWEFFVRLLTSQHRRHRFLGRLTPGFVAWRVHPNSTTGQLWQRHFLEHEQFMKESATTPRYCEALLGDRGFRDSFFASAVRYRYRRLAQDVAKMTRRRVLDGSPGHRALCAVVRLAARAAEACALDAARESEVSRPGGAVRSAARREPAARRRPVAAQGTSDGDQIRAVRVRVGGDHPLGQRTRRVGCDTRQRLQRHAGRRADAQRRPLSEWSGSADDRAGGRNPSHAHCGPPREGVVRIITEYNNSTNFWGVRELIGAASLVVLRELNANRFVEPVLHQCLKFVGVGAQLEATLVDNQHLTSFGFKSLLDRLYQRQFAWVSQKKDGPLQQTFRYERKEQGHRTYSAPHTGWTFGVLTTGNRLANVEQFIDSVERYCRESYEILIVSPVDLGALADRRGVRVLHFDQHDDLGWITKKKNLICDEASYSDILVCHDRFALDEDFTRDFNAWGYAFGLAAVRVGLPTVVAASTGRWSAARIKCGLPADCSTIGPIPSTPTTPVAPLSSVSRSGATFRGMKTYSGTNTKTLSCVAGCNAPAASSNWPGPPSSPLKTAGWTPTRASRTAIRTKCSSAARSASSAFTSFPSRASHENRHVTPIANAAAAPVSPRLYFVHIPKTAGITLKAFLENNYAHGESLVIHEWDAPEDGSPRRCVSIAC